MPPEELKLVVSNKEGRSPKSAESFLLFVIDVDVDVEVILTVLTDPPPELKPV